MRCQIRFLPTARIVEVEAGRASLLEVIREAGLPIASACGENGACARCGLEIVEGAETIEPETEREALIKRRNRVDAALRLACRIHPTGDLTVRAPYW